ncbi:MAG: long-chain fatty acid--CoA ligase [Muribaculaceae bacterium]|nr:long-chain fatty acid--CoA ligase [Muribaculaceae bacterium]
MIPTLVSVPRNITNPEMTAFYFPAEVDGRNKWCPVSRRQFADNVLAVAAALLELKLGVQESIGIFSENRPEILMIDFAAWQLRAIPVNIYATSSADQVRFIVENAEIKHILVGSQVHYDVARKVGVGVIIAADPAVRFDDDDTTSIHFTELLERGTAASAEVHAEVTLRAGQAMPDDLATLLYTSGTTGLPKGAMLTHDNFSSAIELHHRRLTMLHAGDTSLCFLPLSHIFEMAWSCYCLTYSMPLYVNRDTARIQQTIREVTPSCMCAVPRFWEKVYTVVMEKIEAMGVVSRTMAKRALAVGRRRNLEYVRMGLKVPAMLEREYQLYNGRIFRKLRGAIGVENGKLFPTAGAPISTEIVEFCHAVGINLCIGYGLSETTATVSCFPEVEYAIGSVGTLLDGLKVRIGDNSEIQVSGPTVMSGYYKSPEQTAEAFTADGWLHTGDAGRIDSQGNIYITDRIKDLFKTSNGKYIAPQAIESRLGADPLFDQIAVIGDRRKFVSALIVPDFKILAKFAADNNLGAMTREELAANAKVNEFVMGRIEKLTADLAPYEHIKRFTLLTTPFTMERGELTNTLKVRRRVVIEHYADLVDKMYV